MTEHEKRLETVGQLAQGIAHDFNHDLGLVRNFAKMILRDIDDPALVIYDVECILEVVDAGEGLARSLMKFSSTHDVAPEIFSVNEMLRSKRSLLETLRPLVFIFNLDPELSVVKADRGLLVEAIINLCLNARDAIPGGTVTITTRSGPNVDSAIPGLFVFIDVADDGPGIAPEHLGQVFEPFFTTKPLTTMGGGRGLGLATTYGIVKRAEGSITVASRLGKGATFTICLPAGVSSSGREVLQAGT